jgi:phosphotransacetylase
MELTNSKRFIEAYNSIDYALKTRYNLNRSMGFSDLIRKTSALNYVVRKYEDDLVDYGRLRNAIIHNNNDDFVIAEPHESVVENIEHIARLILKPPIALETVAEKDVYIAYKGRSMREIIIAIAGTGYSNIPVYDDNKELIGVANGQKILTSFGQFLIKGGKAEAYLDNVQIEDMLSSTSASNYYSVKQADCTVEEAIEEFNKNHKLLAILFTKKGEADELPLGIMTTGNLIEAQKLIENY